MNALTRPRLTGSPLTCARDMAAIGGGGFGLGLLLAASFNGSSFLMKASSLLHKPEFWILVATATITAGALGLLMPAFLDATRKRLKLRTLWLGGLGLGAAWGWGVANIVGLMTSSGITGRELPYFVALGALVFGLSWFPYVFQMVMGGRRWPVILGGTASVGLVSGLLVYLMVLFG